MFANRISFLQSHQAYYFLNIRVELLGVACVG